MSDPYVPCPAHNCDDGYALTRVGYTVTGSGYGDASPDHKMRPCERCGGDARVHVGTLSDDEWSRLGRTS